jgi:predicted PurR-regulated permease PerM
MTKQAIEISSSTIWRVILILLFLGFLFLIRDVILIFFIAIIIVSAAQPIVNKLQEKKFPRVLAVLLIYFIFLLFLGVVVYLIAPSVAAELGRFAGNLPAYFSNLNKFLAEISSLAANYNINAETDNFIGNFSDLLVNSASQIFSNTLAFLGGALRVVIVLSLSFYMLMKKDAVKIFLKTIIPQKYQDYSVDLADRIQYKMGRWLVGQGSLVIIVFCLYYLALSALGVPYALVLAIIGGLLEIIPYIGPIVAAVPAVLVAFTISPWLAVFVVVAYIVIQQLENHLLTPLIMRKAVGLNPVVIILALLIGGTLAGILGMLVAVPVATAVGVFLKDMVDKKNAKELAN